jgi:hypothetical protein
LHQPSRQLLDRRLCAFVGHGLDEGESARTARVPIQGNAHAAHLDAFAGEGLAELLLVYVVRKIADKKTSTHPGLFLRSAAFCFMWSAD